MEKHKEEIKLSVLGQSLAVGITAGLIVLSYRLVLGYAGTWLKAILAYAKESPIRMAGWFVALLIMATIVGRLLKYEPMISGSGIPQLEGEMEDKMKQTWWKVLPAKYIGGVFIFACRTFPWKGRPVHSAWRDDRKGACQSFET